MSYFYPTYTKKARRVAVGGIKARSRSGRIGETWWSQRFIGVLESFRMGARLTRGQSYARSGQVMDLVVKSGCVSSKVQGTRRTPYEVQIKVEPLPDQDWQRVCDALAARAILMAQLLSGEMPQDIEEVFAACKLSLFPTSTRALDTSCSCPDWANPCKHIAATYYILAEAFDRDPFLIFQWRGQGKEQLTATLRGMRSVMDEQGEEPGVASRNTPPLASCLTTFWQASPALAELHIHPIAAHVADYILRQLGPVPAELRGSHIAELLVPIYEVMTVEAARRAEE